MSQTVSLETKHLSLRRNVYGSRLILFGTYVNAMVRDATIITEKKRITACWGFG